MKPSGSEKWIVCRICLQQPQDGLQPIFENSMERDLIIMISECGGVPIKKNDHYPDKICSKCFKYLKVAHRFRTTCQRSYKHLSRFITPMTSNFEEQVVTLVDDNSAEDLELKVEPMEVKQELELSEGEEIVEVFNAMEDDSKDNVFLERLEEEVPLDETEFLDEEIERDLLDTDDEDYSPYKTSSTRKYVKHKEGSRGMVRGRYIKKEKAEKPPVKPKPQKETSFICDVCGNIYPSKGRLNEHIKVHRPVKPFDCEICGHRFAQTQQLSRHMNTHTGKRPFKCNYCTAAFADLSTRNKHHRIHTNERPYVCDTCGKTFTYTNTLKIHKMIHTGEKPYVCDFCGKAFAQAYKLRAHAVTHEKKAVMNLQEPRVVVEDSMDGDEESQLATDQQLLEM